MAEKITGEGILKIAQLANVARSLLAGPQGFVVKALASRVRANLAGVETITAPIATISSPLATIGKVVGASALAPLGPIGAAAGLITALFGKDEGPQTAIAHLPPHAIIRILHQKEAIHLFLLSGPQMESELQRMESFFGVGAMPLAGNMPRCIAQVVGAATFSQFKGWAKIIGPLNVPRTTLPGYNGSISTASWLDVVSQAWGPGSDDAMKKMIVSIAGARIRGVVNPTTGGLSALVQRRIDEKQASSCATSWWKSQGWGANPVSSFSIDLNKFMDSCPRESLDHFGSPYICAWQASWHAYQTTTLRVYRAEIGDWLHTVAAHPLYKGLIQQMVEVEMERERRRANNARGAVGLIRNPTAEAIRSFAFEPIGPALITKIQPATLESLNTQEQVLVARTAAKSSVNQVQSAILNLSADDEAYREELNTLLNTATAAATTALNSNDATTALTAASEAKVAEDRALAIVTPGIQKVINFFKNPEVLIPALIAAGLFFAVSGEGD